MTIYLVTDHGIEGLDVQKYDWAVDALEEIEWRKGKFAPPIVSIIQGDELTLNQLYDLANKQKEQSNG